ncbi:MAG: acetyltransferase [Sideroxydans sp.]
MEDKSEIILFGASGHAKVILDTLEKAGIKASGLFDDNPKLYGQDIYGYRIMGGREAWLNKVSDGLCRTVVAIGNNRLRHEVACWVERQGGKLAEAVVHPSAQLARGVVLGNGTVVMAGTIVNSDVYVGKNVIINTGASIDHDCVVGDAVHIAPGAILCGGIIVGEQTLVGAGAIVLPNLRIGRKAVIGAGTVVVNDVPDGVTVLGVPARMHGKTNE